jgi:hypothetical protein
VAPSASRKTLDVIIFESETRTHRVKTGGDGANGGNGQPGTSGADGSGGGARGGAGGAGGRGGRDGFYAADGDPGGACTITRIG